MEKKGMSSSLFQTASQLIKVRWISSSFIIIVNNNHWKLIFNKRKRLICNIVTWGVFFWTSEPFWISKTESFQQQDPRWKKQKSGNPKTFVLKFLLNSFPDPFMECLVATGKIAVTLELQTKRISRKFRKPSAFNDFFESS